MANRNHLSQDLPLHSFTGQPQQPPDQPLSANSSRTYLPDQFAAHSLPDPTSKSHHHHPHQPLQMAPNWLNNALLRTQNPHSRFSTATNNANTNFLNLHSNASDSPVSHSSNQWLSRPILHRNHSDVIDEAGDALISPSAATLLPESTELNNNANSGEALNKRDGARVEASGDESGREGFVNWQNARYKAEILAHPLYEQFLSAHVACLRIATPVDQLPRIDAQLAQSQNVVTKYSTLSHGAQSMAGDEKELDQFMTHYALLLCSFKDQLQQHVRVHAMEAVTACWDIEQSLQSLTGVSPGEGTGATMSDDDDDQLDSDGNLFDGSMDTMGFGPLVPTDSERSLIERVRQELKHELKTGYKDKIVDVREEILRKRRAGKLPVDTTSVLKAWWESHAKWPYPTEEDKARLVQETGLQMKQINNWFINQRKRNWHTTNPSTSKTKRKRGSRQRLIHVM